jgi:hypothetical protein
MERSRTGTDIPNLIAVDSTSMYWTSVGIGTGTVLKVPFTGGPTATLASGGLPIAIAVDSTGVYWTDETAGTVNVIPLDGGPSTPIVSPFQFAFAIAVDSKSVYWTTHNIVGVGGQVMELTPK